LVFLARKERKKKHKKISNSQQTNPLTHTYEECHTSNLPILPILLDIPDDNEVLPKHVGYLYGVLYNYGYVQTVCYHWTANENKNRYTVFKGPTRIGYKI